MTGRVLEVALPSEKWARHVADALTDAGWLATVIGLDADHLRERRPDLAELLSADLLIAHLVLASAPVTIAPDRLDAGALPTAGDRCARCRLPIDPDAGPVRIDGEWFHRGCLMAQEADCILDRPPPADPQEEGPSDA